MSGDDFYILQNALDELNEDMGVVPPKQKDIMTQPELTSLRNFFLFILIIAAAGGLAACSVQWAFRNKNTDCGFSNDRINPGGRKDPTVFYGDTRIEDKK